MRTLRLHQILNLGRRGDAPPPAIGWLAYHYLTAKARLSRAVAAVTGTLGRMPHFVADYEHLVRVLMAQFPLDEAMARAVGGNYDFVGQVECKILRHVGLRDGMTLVDLGCGSGRLPHALGKELKIDYTGIDIVAPLLAYARSKSPPHYRFILNRSLSLPVADASADIISAFSVFTHLLPEETYLYLEDMRRVLKPGGCVVFSFIEFAEDDHWAMFDEMVANARGNKPSHLDTFLGRDVIALWARKLGYVCEAFIDSRATPHGGGPLGQSIAVLRR